MKSFALLSLIFVLGSFVPSEVYTFKSEEGSYSIEFPTPFTTENNDQDGFVLVQTQSFLLEQLFFIGHNVHTDEITDHEGIAKVSMDGFVGALGGETSQLKTWKVNGHKGLQANIDVEANNLKAQYKVILIGQVQYQIAVISDPAKWNQSAADAFFASFKVKE